MAATIIIIYEICQSCTTSIIQLHVLIRHAYNLPPSTFANARPEDRSFQYRWISPIRAIGWTSQSIFVNDGSNKGYLASTTVIGPPSRSFYKSILLPKLDLDVCEQDCRRISTCKGCDKGDEERKIKNLMDSLCLEQRRYSIV